MSLGGSLYPIPEALRHIQRTGTIWGNFGYSTCNGSISTILEAL